MASTKDIVTRLKQVGGFSDLTDRELRQVAEAGTHLHLPANRSLMSETTPADKAYVLLAGSVDVRRQGQTVATVGAGNIIGEIGILENRLRTASVVSTTPLDVLHFTNEDLVALVDRIPALAAALQATAQEHLPEG